MKAENVNYYIPKKEEQNKKSEKNGRKRDPATSIDY